MGCFKLLEGIFVLFFCPIYSLLSWVGSIASSGGHTHACPCAPAALHFHVSVQVKNYGLATVLPIRMAVEGSSGWAEPN